MKKIQFDNGIVEYSMNGKGVLRLNPADPNLYLRFSRLGQEIAGISLDPNADPMAALAQADKQLKELLNTAFGCGNDFHKLLEGVNLLAMTGSGKRVFENLLDALSPVLQAGAQAYADAMTQEALAQAESRRGA